MLGPVLVGLLFPAVCVLDVPEDELEENLKLHVPTCLSLSLHMPSFLLQEGGWPRPLVKSSYTYGLGLNNTVLAILSAHPHLISGYKRQAELLLISVLLSVLVFLSSLTT